MKIIKALMQIVCFCYIFGMAIMTFVEVLAGNSRDFIFESIGELTAIIFVIEIILIIFYYTIKCKNGL